MQNLLFRTPRQYLLVLGIGFCICVLFNGMLRHYGNPQRYPLLRADAPVPLPLLWTFNPASRTFHTWGRWSAMDTGDFRPILEAAQDRRTPPDFRMYRPEELSHRPASFVYTPFTALLVSPLARLDVNPSRAADLVSILNHVLVLAVFVLLVLVITNNRAPTLAEGMLYALHYVAFYPLAKALELTQASIWIFFLLSVSIFLFSRKREVLAGLALALGVSIKPHLVVIPLLLATARHFPRRIVYSCFAGLVVTTTISVWYAGLHNSREYVLETLPRLSVGSAYFPNQSVNGLLLRMFTSEDPAVFTLAAPVPWIKLASTAFSLFILAFAVAACRRRRSTDRESDLLCYSIAITAAVLASPLLWEHHFTALILPFGVVVRRLRENVHERTRWLEGILLVSFLLIGVFVDTRYLRGGPVALLSGFQLYGGLLFLGCLTMLVWRPRTAGQKTTDYDITTIPYGARSSIA